MDLRLELVTSRSQTSIARRPSTSTTRLSVEQDVRVDDQHRFVELIPPGSPCSIALTTGYIETDPARSRACKSTSTAPMRSTPVCWPAESRSRRCRSSLGAASASSPIPTATVGRYTGPSAAIGCRLSHPTPGDRRQCSATVAEASIRLRRRPPLPRRTSTEPRRRSRSSRSDRAPPESAILHARAPRSTREPGAVKAIAAAAHDRDDLLCARRVRRIPPALFRDGRPAR